MAIASISLAFLGIVSLSYYDVSAFVGSSAVTLVSLQPNPTHVLALRWRIGEHHPDLDMPGQYVLWTLQPFRKVYMFKGWDGPLDRFGHPPLNGLRAGGS